MFDIAAMTGQCTVGCGGNKSLRAMAGTGPNVATLQSSSRDVAFDLTSRIAILAVRQGVLAVPGF
jgi:hypothetical protein